jgi:biopolymer transport protein ExbD
MAFGTSSDGSFNQINIAPLTDVFLVLLVIMILVAPLADTAVLKVSPPAAPGHAQTSEEDDKTPQIKVDVTKYGSVTINGTAVVPADCPTIQKRIEAEKEKIAGHDPVLNLSSDEFARHKYVVAVMDAAEGAHIKKLRFSTPRKN